jgi:putative transposase
MCALARVSRAGYYRQWADQEPEKEDMEVRDAIQKVALEHRRRYGYRRVTAELRRGCMAVNHKRVLRLMREDNLLAIGKRKFVFTTDSRHQLKVYVNLAKRMELTAINQLWVADITYIRLRTEFVYLAVVIDRFSRRVIGWALDRSLSARLAVQALQQAIAARQPKAGLVHHSDRGIQYASNDYVEVLTAHQMTPSMSQPANPYDNAVCESFMKTLKHEEIYCNEYRDIEDLRAHIGEFIDTYYNRLRLHSALGYRTPEEFENDLQTALPAAAVDAAAMSFFRDQEIYRNEGVLKTGEPAQSHSPAAHPFDESPAGYSSASCSPAELASASPATEDCVTEYRERRGNFSER